MSENQRMNRRSPINALRVERDITRSQLFHVAGFAAVFVIGSSAAMSAHYFLLQHGANGTIPVTGSLWDEFVWQWTHALAFRKALIFWVVSMTGLSAVFAMGLGAHFARNVAGPVHALKRDLSDIAATGSLKAVKLRDGDQLEELAGAINRALTAVGTRGGSPSSEDGEALDRLESLRRDLSTHLERLDTSRWPADEVARIDAWLDGVRELIEKSEDASA